MNFLITGSSSILTQEIARMILLNGHGVTLVGRSTTPSFNLENPEEGLKQHLNNNEYLIHFAHSFKAQSKYDINEEAAERIIECCQGTGIKKIIYISSDSASITSQSRYGQSKFRTERVFLKSDKSLVLRLGIILDDSVPSPFKFVKKVVYITRILAFPSPSIALFRITSVRQVTGVILRACLEEISGGPYSTAIDERLMTIKQVLVESGVKPKWIVPIPTKIFFPLVNLIGNLGLLRRKCDSLLSISTTPETSPTIPG